jgi:hypothetical protein
MTYRIPLATIMAVLLVASMASGQTIVLEGPQGDVRAELVPGQTTVAPPGTRDYADLLSLTATEAVDSFTFHIGILAPDLSVHSQADLAFGFRHASTEFRATMDGTDILLRGLATAINSDLPPFQLERRAVGDELWREVDSYQATLASSPSPGWMTTIPRSALADEDGAEPFPGRSLEAFWATTIDWQCAVVPCVPTGFYDRIPYEGYGETAFPVEFGTEATNEIRVTSPRPLRARNGEEGTFVFNVIVSNDGNGPRSIVLAATSVPDNWQVSLPIAAAFIEPGGRAAIPVILSTPFNHVHGQQITFQVAARDLQTDALVGSIELGIQYLEIPQPAGHHSTLWLHNSNPLSAGNSLPPGLGTGFAPTAYMNAVQQDDLDAGTPIGPQGGSNFVLPTESGFEYVWCIPLSPGLSIGLDFNLESTGVLEGQMRSPTPLVGDFTGSLLVTGKHDFSGQTECGDDPALLVAELGSVPINLEMSAGEGFVLEIRPVEDIVYDRPAQNLLLELRLRIDGATFRLHNDQPYIEPGAYLSLPLHEYHDPVPLDMGFEQVLEVLSDFRVIRNPGSVAVFDLQVSSAGAYEFDVFGTRLEWARIIRVHSDDSRIAVVVTVPEDAPPGAIGDYIVRATSDSGIAFARVVVEVDDSAEHPTDLARLMELEAAGKATSHIGPLALPLVLILLFLRRRQSRT